MKGLYFYFIRGYLVKNKIWHPTIPLVSKKCLLGRCCCCPSSRKLLFSARARMSESVLCKKTRAMALPVNMLVPKREVSWGSTLRQRSTGRLLTADEEGESASCRDEPLHHLFLQYKMTQHKPCHHTNISNKY